MRIALVSSVLAVVMMAAGLETTFCTPRESAHGLCQCACLDGCGRALAAAGHACGDAACTASAGGETNDEACGSSTGETPFDTSEWEGFPPNPVHAMPAPPFRQLPYFFTFTPYRGSLLEPLDPPPRLS